ncbi:MAG TPA: MgtC/SapB family protein [Paucimonas sp.]|nr:MgtC/SapB family protein [Paucimonas sp.]
MPSYETLAAYWSGTALTTNALIFLNILGALLLGLVVGYERSYHGRAAGMRTYGLVCMASAALTVIAGYPDHWFGGYTGVLAGADPTRIIQGITTGIGFLCAGVIMKEGFNISGLTTSASIWAVSSVGVLIGVGFYASAILLALLSAGCMIGVSKIEQWLPARHAVAITLQFKRDHMPEEAELRKLALERGYIIATGSISISSVDGSLEWRFVAVALNRHSGAPISELARELSRRNGIERFHLSHARN